MREHILLVGLVLLAPAEALAASGEAFSPPFLRLALGLILCSALAVAAAFALRRWMQKGSQFSWRWPTPPERRLSVLEIYRLSQHADVCRIASDETEYLVVVSPGAATVLESKPRTQPAQQGEPR